MKVNKSLAGMEDLLCGPRKVTQNRGGAQVEVSGIDLHKAVYSETELANLNQILYPRARLYADLTNYVEYVFDADADAGIAPAIGSGYWVAANNTQIQDVLDQLALDYDAAIREIGNTPLGDGNYSTNGQTFTSYQQYLIYNNTPYKALTLPYTTNNILYPNAYDDPNLRPFAEVTLIRAVALDNNVSADLVALLRMGVSLAGVKYLHEEATGLTYYSVAPLSGVITALGTDVSGVRTVTVGGSDYQVASTVLHLLALDRIADATKQVINVAGGVYSEADLTLLSKAIAGLITNGQYFSVTGTNAYVLSSPDARLMPFKFYEGMTLRFEPLTNTGASTLQVGSLDAKPLLSASGLPTASGTVTGLVEVQYVTSLDAFKLTKVTGGAAGATGGGANKAFYENDSIITENYTITSGKNAMTAGPVTIASGVTVTVPTGSVWTIIGG
jgi:hypothetical protein